jgi:hypothetical protein
MSPTGNSPKQPHSGNSMGVDDGEEGLSTSSSDDDRDVSEGSTEGNSPLFKKEK